MNKSILLLCSVLSLCFSQSYGDEEASKDLFNNAVPGHIVRENVLKEHQKAAKFFGIYMCPVNADEMGPETHLISYLADDDTGDAYHVGWYGDGYIFTRLNGDQEGYQIVVWKGEIVGVSFPSVKKPGVAINKYSWGHVSTQQQRQYVEGIENLKH